MKNFYEALNESLKTESREDMSLRFNCLIEIKNKISNFNLDFYEFSSGKGYMISYLSFYENELFEILNPIFTIKINFLQPEKGLEDLDWKLRELKLLSFQ